MTLIAKAKSTDYGLGPHTYPRGWFVVAEAIELDAGPLAVTYFGKDFALYRGESGRVVMLDAYCMHMKTHLTKSNSAHIVTSGHHIEGDSIRCPYHAWKYGPDGSLEEIPYQPGVCPKSANITAYTVKEVMGCIMMWHDPEGGAPDYEPPFIPSWDSPSAIHWQLDHLGMIPIHNIEVLDNMCDVHHLGPTHGSPCEYFENEFRDHQVIQRQGGFLATYESQLDTVTWYTGPGILLSKQAHSGLEAFEIIANTPVGDGISKAWHGLLSFSAEQPVTETDIKLARQMQAGALAAFATDFDVWQHKQPALKVMQTKDDGNFKILRQWVSQFYMPREEARQVQSNLNGVLPVNHFPEPDKVLREAGFEDDCFQLYGGK